jgi:hypothetical protein
MQTLPLATSTGRAPRPEPRTVPNASAGAVARVLFFLLFGLGFAGGLVWMWIDNRPLALTLLPGAASIIVILVLTLVDPIRCMLFGVPLSALLQIEDTPSKLIFRNKKHEPWQYALLFALIAGWIVSAAGFLAPRFGLTWTPSLPIMLAIWIGCAALMATAVYLRRSAQWRNGHFDYVLDRTTESFSFPFTPVDNISPSGRITVPMLDALHLQYSADDPSRMHAIFLVDAAGHTWFLRDSATREYALLIMTWLGEQLDIPVIGPIHSPTPVA